MMKKEGSKAFYYFQFSRAHCVKDSRGEVVKDVCLVTPKDILQFSNLFTMEWWGNFLLRLLFFCLVYFLHVLILCRRQTHSQRAKKLKKVQTKKLVKSNKSI